MTDRYKALSRAQREAYAAWQNASGEAVAPALDAYRKACKELDAYMAELSRAPTAASVEG